MSLLSTLAERLKRVRSDSNLKQSDFAAKIGVKQSYLSAMERGIRPVPTKIATAIIEQFGVSQEWLFSADRDINNSGVVPLNSTPSGTPIQKVGKRGTTTKSIKKASDATVEAQPPIQNEARRNLRDPNLKTLRQYQSKLTHQLQQEEPALATLKSDLELLSWLFEDAKRVMEELEIHYTATYPLANSRMPYHWFKELALRDLKRRTQYREAINQFNFALELFTQTVREEALQEEWEASLSEMEGHFAASEDEAIANSIRYPEPNDEDMPDTGSE